MSHVGKSPSGHKAGPFTWENPIPAYGGSGTRRPRGVPPRSAGGGQPPASTARSAQTPGAAHTAPEPVAAPARVRVPSIDVDTTLLHLGLDADGVLEVPQDPELVGWFSWATAAGDVGVAVIAGHVDSPDGRGVF